MAAKKTRARKTTKKTPRKKAPTKIPPTTKIHVTTNMQMDDKAQQALADENQALYKLVHELGQELISLRIRLAVREHPIYVPSDWTITPGEAENG
jgi:hypothetical protein